MSNEIVKITMPTPILTIIDKTLVTMLKRNLSKLVTDTNKAIEAGVRTKEKALKANAIVEDGRKAIKVVKEVRLTFTRPLDEVKKRLIDEEEKLSRQLTESNKKLDGMVIERDAELEAEEAERQRAAEEAQRAAEEAARKKEEANKKISIAKGGDGDVKPVVAEQIPQPISLYKMNKVAHTRSVPDLVKIDDAVESGTREIAGVKIYQVWQFDVTESKKVPPEYRKDIRG